METLPAEDFFPELTDGSTADGRARLTGLVTGESGKMRERERRREREGEKEWKREMRGREKKGVRKRGERVSGEKR